MKKFSAAAALITAIILSTGCLQTPTITHDSSALPHIHNTNDLDRNTLFSFAIMSDNKGDSPENSIENSRMVQWIKERNDRFVVGLGDHVKLGWDNSFLDLLKNNPWWHDNFYPCIADGENEYYGDRQKDRRAGGGLLKEMNFSSRKNVVIRNNGSEYYAKIVVEGYTIHLIQLHFPDEPRSIKVAFPEDTRQYLKIAMQWIRKGPKDIIIVGAHTRSGFWIDILDDDLQKLVMEKADLVLSASTHYFEKKILSKYKNTGALLINTGSVNYPLPLSYGGYIRVSVIENPLSMIVQYINVEDEEEITLSDRKHAILKVIDGNISFIDFSATSKILN